MISWNIAYDFLGFFLCILGIFSMYSWYFFYVFLVFFLCIIGIFKFKNYLKTNTELILG
jgi:hypothetical protein